ncbi:MAG: hypothetical protein OSA99_00315 [Acidimicrobiales bacterium]|nr:hypothetical protein [Acidimicrobiales bacterium]
MPDRFLHGLARGALVALFVSSVGACTERQDLKADTARVQWSDRRAELDVISCGLDDAAFVLAAESASGFVQLLLVVDEPDAEEREIDTDRSAVTAEVDAGVLGAGDADLLGVPADEPGQITRAAIRGDRIDVEADARVLGGSDGQTVPLEIAARCPAVEDLA